MENYTVRKSDLNAFVKRFLESLSKKTGGATVVGLSGNLGAGKTTFTQVLAHELGILGPITSPTFVLQKRYPVQSDLVQFDTLIHIDAYRIEEGRELQVLGFDEDLNNQNNLIVIEWPEHVADVLPENTQTLSFTVVDSDTRMININNGKEKNTEK